MRFQIGAMSVGDILDRGLKLLFTRLGTFYAIDLIFLGPMILLHLFAPIIGGSQGTVTAIELLANLFTNLVLQPLATAAQLHVVAQEFVDRRVGIGDAIAFALRRFGALFGASMLVGVIVVAVLAVCFVPMIIIPLLGFVFMPVAIVLIVMIMVWYIFISQVVVVEGAGPGQALTRSKALTEGFRGRVLGVLLLVIVTGIIIGVAAGLFQSVLPIHDAGGNLNFGNYATTTILSQLAAILVQTYFAICWTLFYFDIRIRKEGFDLELLAKQQATEHEKLGETL